MPQKKEQQEQPNMSFGLAFRSLLLSLAIFITSCVDPDPFVAGQWDGTGGTMAMDSSVLDDSHLSLDGHTGATTDSEGTGGAGGAGGSDDGGTNAGGAGGNGGRGGNSGADASHADLGSGGAGGSGGEVRVVIRTSRLGGVSPLLIMAEAVIEGATPEEATPVHYHWQLGGDGERSLREGNQGQTMTQIYYYLPGMGEGSARETIEVEVWFKQSDRQPVTGRIEVRIDDPATVFPDTSTICVANAPNNVDLWDGCPQEAARQNLGRNGAPGQPLDSVFEQMENLNGKRVLLRRGDQFTLSNTLVFQAPTEEGDAPFHLSDFGPDVERGTEVRPIISVETGLLDMAGPQDIRLTNLVVRPAMPGPDTTAVTFSAHGSGLLMDQIHFDQWGSAVDLASGGIPMIASDTAITRSYFTQRRSGNRPDIRLIGERFALVSNTIEGSSGETTAYTSTELTDAGGLVVHANRWLGTIADGNHVLLDVIDYAQNDVCGRESTIHHNEFQGGEHANLVRISRAAAPVRLSPCKRRQIIEGNVFSNRLMDQELASMRVAHQGRFQLTIEGQGSVVQNNIFDLGVIPKRIEIPYRAVLLSPVGNGDQDYGGYEIAHNTVYTTPDENQGQDNRNIAVVGNQGDVEGVVVRSNLLVAPRATDEAAAILDVTDMMVVSENNIRVRDANAEFSPDAMSVVRHFRPTDDMTQDEVPATPSVLIDYGGRCRDPINTTPGAVMRLSESQGKEMCGFEEFPP